MTKNILGVSVLWVLWTIFWVSYYFGFLGLGVNANPDYICTKSVTNQVCKVPAWNWGEWNTNWERVWTWTRATEVQYYATRTGCEAWYTENRWWWYRWWASWRKTADTVSASSVCTLIQTDNVPPVWEISN